MSVSGGLVYVEEVTMEAGETLSIRTEWEGKTHYRYRVVECPVFIEYRGAFTQVFRGGFDYITSVLRVAPGAPPGVHRVRVNWGWSDQPMTFRGVTYTLRLGFDVTVTPPNVGKPRQIRLGNIRARCEPRTTGASLVCTCAPYTCP